MLPSECPYPEAHPDHPATHPLGTGALEGSCAQCHRYFRRCPGCQAANRWLARFCRNCGQGLQAHDWLPEHAEAPLSPPWPQNWSQRGECGFAPHWMALLDGRLFILGSSGALRVLTRADFSLESPYAPLGPLFSAPSYLHGYLAVPGPDQITLVDLLETRPGNGRRQQRLRGRLLCPPASDQAQWLAALVHDGDTRSLQLFRLHQGKLQLAWNQVVDGSGPDPQRFPRLFWCDQVLVYLGEDGELRGLDPISGSAVFQLHCPCPPHGLPPWSASGQAFWGGQDGSLWWLRTHPEVQLHQLSGSQDVPMYALGASSTDLVASYGRKLLRIQLATGRSDVLELPQYCTVSPWLGEDYALVPSQEGQLYRVSLGSQTFQVESSERMPPSYSGSALAPLWTGWSWIGCDAEGRLYSAEPWQG